MSLPPTNAFEDLEQAIAQGTRDARESALWRATDMLLVGKYSEEQIWVFGEIIDRLAVELELQARAKLANVLSQSQNAPIQTIKKLANDDAIGVAGPVLRHSTRLGEQDLIDTARAKGQQHLLSIAQRQTLSPRVTDELVTRGDQRVVRAVAGNGGARFSDKGFWNLVKRSENDSYLAECVGTRKDIPRQLFFQLIAKASEEVKRKLAAAAPAANEAIQHAVADAAGAFHARFGPSSKRYFEAKKYVTDLKNTNRLNERQLHAFAIANQFEEAAVTLSLLCSVPPDVAERALIEETPKLILILGRSAGFSWQTVQSLIVMAAGDKGVAKEAMDSAFAGFSGITETVAKKVVGFYKARRQNVV